MACRTARAKRDLLRIVRTPDRQVVIDRSGRLAGRGAYVCVDPACIRTAVAKGALRRALEIPLPEAFLASLEAETSTNHPNPSNHTPNPPNTSQGGARGQE